ncbi:hypothetical protein F4679DRAFT_402787 [Xylaria curta]|nr:hypothetical protein F4679DRAFT_402787 [Xylaria curta]
MFLLTTHFFTSHCSRRYNCATVRIRGRPLSTFLSLNPPFASPFQSYTMALAHNMPRSHSIPPHDALPTVNSPARKLGSKSTSYSNSASSSSRSCSHPSQTTLGYCPDVADTNPKRTAQLWDAVMSHRNNTWNSEGPAATSITGTTMKEASAKVTDADFSESVLEPYGITILTKGFCTEPMKHFGITEFSNDGRNRVQTYKTKFPDLNVWLEYDEIEFIQRAYVVMAMHQFNDAEHEHFAMCHICRTEPLHQDLGNQRLMPYRTIQLHRKVGEGEWLSPPILPHKTPKQYEWDTLSDCTYHFSLAAFEGRFRGEVKSFTSVIHRQGICPYFTVDFKKDDQSIETARYRVAASSALSLYNRYLLKCNMREATLQNQTDWTEEDKSHIRHYGLAFTGSLWTLYCILPKTFSEWTGCTMRPLYQGDCLQIGDIESLIALVNDVHYWGLAVHGVSCKQDIYRVQESEEDLDMCDISLVDLSLEDTSSAE